MNRTNWFHEARFGMFIHWGAYSVAGRGEWVLNRENIPYDEYTEKYVNNFKAENYHPEEWVALAKDAGMKYLVLTTRHHDGFSLWDTQVSDFNSVKLGPKRDLVRSYVDAVRVGGLKVGLYYSFADWHHPDYPGAYFRDWPTGWKDEASRKRFIKYYRSQLEELMTNYGKIDLLWYDGCCPDDRDSRAVNSMVRELQPEILINQRNGEPFDFKVCEKEIKPPEEDIAWESCMTMMNHWGYHYGDDGFKSTKEILKLLLRCAGQAGNLLLNIGPLPDGSVLPENQKRLREVGAWLKKNGEFLANSSRSPFSWDTCKLITTKENRIYLHVLYEPPEDICVTNIKNKVLGVSFVASGESIDFEKQPNRLFLKNLPSPLSNDVITSIVIEVEGMPEANIPKL